MPCCGRAGQRWGSAPARSHLPNTSTIRAPQIGAVLFEYVGRTGLTVAGPVSGRRYRFDAPGSVVAVDPADQSSLAALPQLRRVAGR